MAIQEKLEKKKLVRSKKKKKEYGSAEIVKGAGGGGGDMAAAAIKENPEKKKKKKNKLVGGNKKRKMENVDEQQQQQQQLFSEDKSKQTVKKKKKKNRLEVNKLTESAATTKTDGVYQISSGDRDCSKGMKKWVTEYRQSRPGLEVLQQRIDEFIIDHDEREEQARQEREALAAEGGWTVVVHHKGRKKTTDSESGTTVGSVAQAAVEDKMAKKKTKEVGDFYRFQKREAQMNGLSNSSLADCVKHDPEVSEDMEKNFTELLSEELKLREAEASEHQRKADMALLEAKKMASQYQKEADKCNSGMETCEEARERAEATLVTQKRLTAMWELRARQRGWKEGTLKTQLRTGNVQAV